MECVHRCDKNTFVRSSAKGCHVVHYNEDWIVGVDDFDEDDYDDETLASLPDISLDPETRLLSVVNPSDNHRVYYITSRNPFYDTHMKELETGVNTDAHGMKTVCTTLVVLAAPRSIVDLVYVATSLDAEHDNSDVSNALDLIDLTSDVQDLHQHPSPDAFDPSHVYLFPLPKKDYRLSSNVSLTYRCSQGINGCFTHYFPGTYHSYDLECPLGTPVLAIDDGEVVDIRQDNTESGIGVENLFKWNSVMLRLHDGNYVEYVHIQRGSCQYKIGDHVRRGQLVCYSGNIGFCPSPHLHIQMHASSDPKAPTIKFAFSYTGDKSDPAAFFPTSGGYF